MNLKKYLVLDVRNTTTHTGNEQDIKVKIVSGFTRDNTESAMDIQTGWTPQGNDRLFFFPGCNVPRFKVRDKFSCTIKLKNATAAFVSKDTMEGSESTFDYYKNVMPLDERYTRLWMRDLKNSHIVGLFFSLLGNGVDGIYATQDLWQGHAYEQSFHKNGETFSSAECLGENIGSYHCKNIMAANQYQLLGFNRKNGMDPDKLSVYLEDDLLKHLNAGKLILDEEKYQEFRGFGLAKDYDNLVLMMELMSNCDFEKSVVYLLFLLKEFGKEIQDTKESSHVNFKSLLSYLKLDPKKVKFIGINDMTRILREHSMFTRANSGRLSMLFAGEKMNYQDNNNVCWTEGPVLKADCETLLNDY